MGFNPHPRPATAIYSGPVRVWAAASIFYPGQTTDAVSDLSKKNSLKPHICPNCYMRIDMGIC
jgi:hypothetical protein